MRIRSIAVVVILAALPAVAEQSNAVGPFPPGNPILNPVEAPRTSQTQPSTVSVPRMTQEEAIAAEIAARQRLEASERDMDRAERDNKRDARTMQNSPPVAVVPQAEVRLERP